MATSTAHAKMKVAVAFDQAHQLRQDSLVADVMKIVDDEDELAIGRLREQRRAQLVEARWC